MDWQRQCTAVIPCFNEADQIASVIRQIEKFLPNILVVDDGSTDATAEIAFHSGAKILSLPKNSGKGFALRAGWQWVRQSDFNWVLMLDGDGQHSAGDISGFFNVAEKSGAKLVVGNRLENCATMPWLRRKVNFWMSHRLSELTGHRLPDSQCGFRLAHLDTLLRLPLSANRFEIESEMLVAFLAAHEKIEFVPVQTIYQKRASHIQPLLDSVRWLRWRLAQTAAAN